MWHVLAGPDTFMSCVSIYCLLFQARSTCSKVFNFDMVLFNFKTEQLINHDFFDGLVNIPVLDLCALARNNTWHHIVKDFARSMHLG